MDKKVKNRVGMNDPTAKILSEEFWVFGMFCRQQLKFGLFIIKRCFARKLA